MTKLTPEQLNRPITLGDLREALRNARASASASAQWEYDTIKDAKLQSQIELCERLAEAFGLTLD